MSNDDDLVNQFSSITGVDGERAKVYLEWAVWNLPNAISIYYEDEEREALGLGRRGVSVGGDPEEDGDEDGVEKRDSASDPPPPPSGSLDMGALMDALSPAVPQSQEQQKQTTSPTTRQDKTGKIGTVADINRNDGSSDEEGEAFYAGGSERSGQQIVDRSRGRVSPNSFVASLFQAAREHGAEELTSTSQQGRGSQTLAFRGTGYRLGETQAPTEAVPGTSQQIDIPMMEITLKMWKKGFSIDSGDLRPYTDSANQEFLDSIRMGVIPQELVHKAGGRMVSITMEDHRTERFVKPHPQPFTGTGHRLGSPTPTMSRSVPLQASARGAAACQPPKAVINTSKPVTTVQIRLANGQRILAKFNTTHTVRDLRTFIMMSHPEYVSTSFVLLSTFPHKELTDETQTLEEANLCNSVVVQHML